MVLPPIDTPRTEVGNVTYASRIGDLSVAESFHAPSDGNDDLLKQIRGNKRGINFRTPGARAPFADRRNVTTAKHQEFTPLMKSTTKANMQRRNGGRLAGMPETPGILKPGYQSEESPALPEISRMTGENTASSFETENDGGTPIPPMPSSSVASTPLVVLPRRDYRGGVLTEGANVLTLREQEQTINKIEKENFNLKLKITFLEKNLDKLRATGAKGFNEIALRENTELKIAKVTMQKELRQHRKTLDAAEHDLEVYRQQLAEVQEKVRRKHADQGQREEMEQMRRVLNGKEEEIQKLSQKIESQQLERDKVNKIRDEVTDLEAELRDKERLLDEKDGQIDTLQDQLSKEGDAAEKLEDELVAAQRRLQELEEANSDNEQQAKALEEVHDELEQANDKVERLENDLKTAHEERRKADEEREQFESDLIELRDEMANKSLSTKGLSRQLEEKANKLQNDLQTSKSEHSDLKKKHEDKSRLVQALQERVDELELEMDSKEQSASDKLKQAQHERENAARERQSSASQMQQKLMELEKTNEQKELLQSRHDALTAESQTLQKDLAKAQRSINELEDKWNNEKRLALENERVLRQANDEQSDRLTQELDDLRRELDDRERQLDDKHAGWDSQRRALESQRNKAEEKAAGLKRTVETLQETEGTLSGNETNLRKALESEKQRHESEEAILERQIQELSSDVEARRHSLEEIRDELARVKEELRISRRGEDTLAEKVQCLEDEVDVLQVNLDEESEHAREQLTAAKREVEGLKSQAQTLKQKLAESGLAHADARTQLDAIQGNLQNEEGSKEQLSQRLKETEAQLIQVKKEKQSLQDQLATVNIEMHSLRASVAEVEAERDELRNQVKQALDQVDGAHRLDQEKVELRKSNIRLESDNNRLKEERKRLLEMKTKSENELESEIDRANIEEDRLNTEISKLQMQLNANAEARVKEALAIKRDIQRLESRNAELERQIEEQVPNNDAATELSMIRRDLAVVRGKETDYIHREANYKERTRDLQRKVVDLERQVHDFEIEKLAMDSPKSSIGGSARKNEIIEVRRQLSDALQQMKELRSQVKDTEREAQRKIIAIEREFQTQKDAKEHEKELLEQEIADTRLQQEEYFNKNKTAERGIARLQTKVSHLEKELQHARLTNGENTIAEERKDLHEMLKDAKLEVEDLQAQILDRDGQIESSVLREKDLRSQLKRIREERTLLSQKANAANTELNSLQRRYERTLDKMAHLQQDWNNERKAITQRVRFPNTSLSSLHGGESTAMVHLEQDMKAKETRHQAEIKGLAKQIQYLRAKCGREEGFRADLAYSKKFFLMQIELYNACNQADLQMLEEIGITPDRSIRERRPSLRSVGWMVLASVRMKRMQSDWAGSRKIHASLAKKVEQMRRQSKKGIAR